MATRAGITMQVISNAQLGAATSREWVSVLSTRCRPTTRAGSTVATRCSWRALQEPDDKYAVCNSAARAGRALLVWLDYKGLLSKKYWNFGELNNYLLHLTQNN